MVEQRAPLSAGGADLVAAVERVEHQLARIGGAGRRFCSAGQCAVEALAISNRFCVAAVLVVS